MADGVRRWITRDEPMLGGVALLLAIDLLFLPWFEVSVGIGSVTLSASSTATGSPDGWLGVLGVRSSSSSTSTSACSGSASGARSCLSAALVAIAAPGS